MTGRPLALLALLASTTLAVAGCGSSGSGSAGTANSSADSKAASGICSYPVDTSGKVARTVTKPSANPSFSGPVKVTITTNFGPMTATLDTTNTPCATNSFVSLAKQRYFDKTDCHRVTKVAQGDQGFHVLQCGDPTGTGTGGPGYRFQEELSGTEDYRPGSLALANTGQPGSSGAQFFIDYDTTSLPAQYTEFGQLSGAGLKVAQKAAAAATMGKPNGYDGKPTVPVEILKVTVQAGA